MATVTSNIHFDQDEVRAKFKPAEGPDGASTHAVLRLGEVDSFANVFFRDPADMRRIADELRRCASEWECWHDDQINDAAAQLEAQAVTS